MNFDARTIQSVLRSGLMMPRPDWNRIGPKIPKWFRAKLKKLDKYLYLQFMPPSYADPDGVDGNQFPYGVWTICRYLPNSRWLLKRWTWHLSDAQGFYSPPDGNTVAILKYAYDCYRASVEPNFEEMLDSHVAQLKDTGKAASKAERSNRVMDTIRKHNLFSNIGGKTRLLFRKQVPWKAA